MSKMRAFQLARELEIDTKEFLQKMADIGMPLKSHMSTIPDDEVEGVKRKLEELGRGQTVETRISGKKKTVIRRRAAKVEPLPPELLEVPVEPAPPVSEAPPPVEPSVAPPEKARPEIASPEVAPPEVAAPEVAAPEVAPPATSPEPAVSPPPAMEEGVRPAAKKAAPTPSVEPEPSIPKRRGEREETKPRKKIRPAARKAREVIDVLPEELPSLGPRALGWRGGGAVRAGGVQTYRPSYRKRTVVKKGGGKTLITTPKASKRVVKISGEITVQDLARRMGVKGADVQRKLVNLGMMVNVNASIDVDAASLAAHEFGYEVENIAVEVESLLAPAKPDEPEQLLTRPPVVTVMGHVDHGKTSLLDVIRHTTVAAGESGGITQHIGAYHVKLPKGEIVFLDTPGHEAFTAMRARGAQVTDIVVLVVAADDGVMPQTVEAVNHAKAAGVPILVAINKMDKPGADPDRIRNKLMEHGLVPESFGGDTIFVHVSAKQKTGLEDLLESILLQAEVLELKANPKKLASGVVIEAKVEKGRGPVATVLVREGTLKRGDTIVAGSHQGRVRAMKNDRGKPMVAVTPGLPAEVQGLSGVPMAGETFNATEDEQVAREVAEGRAQRERRGQLVQAPKVDLENLFDRMQGDEAKELRVVIKADSQGSVEAMRDALNKLSGKDVQVRTIHGAVGGISESDIMLASASDAIAIGFHVRPDLKAQALARREKVRIALYKVIYEAVDEIRKAMEGLLAPTVKETTSARAEVRDVFSIQRVGTIAGCVVSDGTVKSGSRIRVIRDSVEIYDGRIGSLRRFKDDVREVASGLECGVRVENFNDVKVGDILETYQVEEVAPRLESSTASS
jgi:translation initiation factor IF-2